MCPNQPSPHKQILGAKINRELYYKFSTLPKRKGVSMNDLLTELIEHDTNEIELSLPSNSMKLTRRLGWHLKV